MQKAFPEVQVVYKAQQMPNLSGESTNRLLTPWSWQMAILTSSLSPKNPFNFSPLRIKLVLKRKEES